MICFFGHCPNTSLIDIDFKSDIEKDSIVILSIAFYTTHN